MVQLSTANLCRLGMFLYARLVLDYLSTNIFYSGDEVKTSIDHLPDKLSDLYATYYYLPHFTLPPNQTADFTTRLTCVVPIKLSEDSHPNPRPP